MKKLILITVFALAFVGAEAQFRLTADGFRSQNNRKSDYIVFDIPSRDQAELFSAAAYFLTTRFSRPGDILIDAPLSITVVSRAREAVVGGKRRHEIVYDVEFELTVDIGEGKVRVWAPRIKSIKTSVDHPRSSSHHSVGHPDNDDSINPYLYVSRKYSTAGARRYRRGEPTIFGRCGGVRQRQAKNSAEDYFNLLVQSLERQLRSGAINW